MSSAGLEPISEEGEQDFTVESKYRGISYVIPNERLKEFDRLWAERGMEEVLKALREDDLHIKGIDKLGDSQARM